MNSLTQIQKRLDSTTPGTWMSAVKPSKDGSYLVTMPGIELLFIAKVGIMFCHLGEEKQNAKEDADFIANAKDDIQFLLDEIKLLQTALQKIN